MSIGRLANFLNLLDEKNRKNELGPPFFTGDYTTQDNSSGSAFLQANVPTSIKVNDLALIFIMVEVNTSHITSVPAGWTNITNNNDGVGFRAASFGKIWTGSDSNPISFGFDTSRKAAALAVVLKETHQTAFKDDWFETAGGPSGSISFAGNNVAADNSLDILFPAINSNSAVLTPPSGYTQFLQYNTGNSIGRMAVAYKAVLAGAQTPGNYSSTTTTQTWLGSTFDIPPMASTT